MKLYHLLACLFLCFGVGATSPTSHQAGRHQPARTTVSQAHKQPTKPKIPAKEVEVASVVDGKGTAKSRDNTVSLKPPKRVCAGWVLSCAPNSKLVICYDNGEKATILPGKPHKIRFIPHSPGPNDALITVGGTTQSEVGTLYSPPPSPGRVWPEHFIVRWTPLPKGTKIGLILRDRSTVLLDDTPLWSAQTTEDGIGVYDSQELRNKLTALRNDNPNAKPEFTLALPDGKSHTVGFNLLPKEADASLKQELHRWEKEDIPLLRHMALSSAYLHAALYTEAADEMEQALATHPESVELRIATIWAHRRSGNLAREEYQMKLLPPGTKIPGD